MQPATSQADSAGVHSAHCMGDAWSAGFLLWAQVRQQGLSGQQPVSTIRPGPGPRQHLPDLLLREMFQGRMEVVRLSQTPGSSAQLSPGLVSPCLAPWPSAPPAPCRKEGGITEDTTLGIASWSEGTNSAGLRVLSSGWRWALTHLLCVHAKSLQSCPILCNLMDCRPPGSSVHWILQAGILEWAVMPSSRRSS